MVLDQWSIRWWATVEVRCERGETRESQREHTHVFLMNRLDNRLDNIFHDTDVIRIGLVVPDPHESPRLLLKVPSRLDDPVIILFFCSFQPVYGFLRIVSRAS